MFLSTLFSDKHVSAEVLYPWCQPFCLGCILFYLVSLVYIPYSHCSVFVVRNPLCVLRVRYMYVSSQCSYSLLCPLCSYPAVICFLLAIIMIL